MMRRLYANQLIWLALTVVTLAEAAMPYPVKEQDVEDCNAEIRRLNGEKTQCEDDIVKAQVATGGKVEGYKRYFTDVENQMKNLEPQIADLKTELNAKYAREAELHKELRTASRVTAFSNFLHRDDPKAEGCPSVCMWPNVHSGDPGNGGTLLVNDRCLKYASKVYGMGRFCGEGASYEFGQYTRCTGCYEEVLVDQYMKCDDDRKIAQQALNGCKTKAKTVEMWSSARERQYKNKADVYIMRASRLADPLSAQIKESSRASATITRMERQIEEVKQNLPIAD